MLSTMFVVSCLPQAKNLIAPVSTNVFLPYSSPFTVADADPTETRAAARAIGGLKPSGVRGDEQKDKRGKIRERVKKGAP